MNPKRTPQSQSGLVQAARADSWQSREGCAAAWAKRLQRLQQPECPRAEWTVVLIRLRMRMKRAKRTALRNG